MDARTILKIKPELTRYLRHFDGCFGRCTARQHLGTYVAGQLGPLQRKSVEPMADAAGVPSRNLQQFLSLYRWDEALMRDRHQQRIAAKFAHVHSVGIIDETSFVKKGDKTAGVQRQHCGAVGKQENCVVSVHLGYAMPDFHTMLDGDLYLPEKTWHADRGRCRAAGIPDDVVYRPKWQIALEQLRRARGNGIRFAWLSFDEGYGAGVDRQGSLFPPPGRIDRRAAGADAATQRQGPSISSQANDQPIARDRPSSERDEDVSLATLVAV